MADARDTTSGARLEDGLDALCTQVMASFALAGLAVGVVQDEQIVYVKGFGVRNLERRDPVTAHSLFHLASNSKPFVATGVMQLVEHGQVDLGAPVTAYVPFFTLHDERAHAITVQQLLSHTSGMPDELEFHWDQPEDDEGALDRYVRHLAGAALLFAPGERYSYSNMAYEVLGALIAQVSGMPFETYMQREVLHPLQMDASTFLKRDVPAQLATTPYICVPELERSPVYPYHRAHAPSSTLHSSALEMCHWASAQLRRGTWGGQRILSADSYDLLWRPYAPLGDAPPESMGLGWFLGTYKGYRRVSHGGADTGFQTSLTLVPELGLGVVVLANALPAPLSELRQAVFGLLLGEAPEPPKPPVLVALNDILRDQGVAAALAEYRGLQEQHPNDYAYGAQQFFTVGDILISLNRTLEAQRILACGIAIDPDAAEGYSLLALLHQKCREEEQARTAVAQALQRDPQDTLALILTAQLSAR
jgi:CubicO group peptidase (beta-lactamase class C family)